MKTPFLVFLAALLAASTAVAQRTVEQPSPRPDPLRDAELQQIRPLTAGVREDDHPAIASRGDAVWVAWVSYSETEGNSHIYVRSWRNGEWAGPEQVSEQPGDYHKPAIAVDEQQNVWVAWPAQVRGNWDLYGRRKAGASWSAVERWTEDPGPDLLPQLAARGSDLMLVWQGLREGGSDILYRVYENGRWGAEGPVANSPANDWEPAVAASDHGFHVAWDSYRGDYDVFVRSYTRGRWGAEIAVTNSPRLESRASLSVDSQDRLWIAFEIGPEQWAYDSRNAGLRARRDIGLACLDGTQLYRARTAEQYLRGIAGESGLQAPAPAVGEDGKLRLFFRRPMNRNWMLTGMILFDGSNWEAPEEFLYSEGRIDQRVVFAELPRRLVAVYPAGSSHNVIYAREFSVGGGTAAGRTLPLEPVGAVAAKEPRPRPAAHAFNGYRLVWGDLHRHTDISEDGGLVDGSLIDAMRYAMDAAAMDFLGISDHTRYMTRRYNIWRLQQIADLFHRSGTFVGMHAYERSQFSPWGHRNVVYADRYDNMVPASYDIGDFGVSPWGLWEALRGEKAITIPHTSAWVNKQVSWDYHDPEKERLVEIYQGLRSTYEYNGAPDPQDRAIYEPDSKNFVWNALERKLKMGFIASSDHRSTHMSFAAVYAKDFTRQGIYEALYARRTYAATEKILLEFSIGGHMMGEEIEVGGPPELEVRVEGTTDLAQIDVIKNNTFVYTVKPGEPRASFRFRDHQYRGGDSYYYVRVIQQDKHMAWASPIWVKKKR